MNAIKITRRMEFWKVRTRCASAVRPHPLQDSGWELISEDISLLIIFTHYRFIEIRLKLGGHLTHAVESLVFNQKVKKEVERWTDLSGERRK